MLCCGSGPVLCSWCRAPFIQHIGDWPNSLDTVVLILQPDEPYVSYIGSNGDYNPFVYQAGISSMDIRFMGGPEPESMQNLSMVFPTRFTSKKNHIP